MFADRQERCKKRLTCRKLYRERCNLPKHEISNTKCLLTAFFYFWSTSILLKSSFGLFWNFYISEEVIDTRIFWIEKIGNQKRLLNVQHLLLQFFKVLSFSFISSIFACNSNIETFQEDMSETQFLIYTKLQKIEAFTFFLQKINLLFHKLYINNVSGGHVNSRCRNLE